jgi:tetratricopeptide (TPR) repeat protein
MLDAPDDPSSLLVLARAMARLGDAQGAAVRLRAGGDRAPGTPLHAEAQKTRFALEHPKEAAELEAALRAACNAAKDDLGQVAARARRLAMAHDAWLGWVACAIAERRSGRAGAAREASEAALAIAPGCGAARAELVAALLAMNHPAAAVEHAERALLLEGENPRTLGLLARALLAAGRREDAFVAATRAVALDESDDGNRTLRDRIKESVPKEGAGVLARLRRLWR